MRLLLLLAALGSGACCAQELGPLFTDLAVDPGPLESSEIARCEATGKSRSACCEDHAIENCW